jgi:hypothetical protein
MIFSFPLLITAINSMQISPLAVVLAASMPSCSGDACVHTGLKFSVPLVVPAMFAGDVDVGRHGEVWMLWITPLGEPVGSTLYCNELTPPRAFESITL